MCSGVGGGRESGLWTSMVSFRSQCYSFEKTKSLGEKELSLKVLTEK